MSEIKRELLAVFNHLEDKGILSSADSEKLVELLETAQASGDTAEEEETCDASLAESDSYYRGRAKALYDRE